MSAFEEFNIWMYSHRNIYLNDYAVLFNKAPGFVLVDSPWPTHRNAFTLSIVMLCGNVTELFNLLKIDTFNDLEQVQPLDLLSLFFRGEAMVLCKISKTKCLRFEKVGTLMLAGVDGESQVHAIPEQLKVPRDFFNYTRQYYQRLKEKKRAGLINTL